MVVDKDIGSTTISDMETQVTDFTVDTKVTDGPSGLDETEWTFPNWSKWYGYYLKIPELKSAIDAVARWTIGRGFEADAETTVVLDEITGYGDDTFDTILKNMITVSQIVGDAFAEIIRSEETGEIINLKPLDVGVMKIIVNKKGIIKRYEQTSKGDTVRTFKVHEIFHLVRNRIADSIHGTSVVEAVEDIILMRNEALTDWRKVLHRNINPLKIVTLDTDKQSKINSFITKWEKTVKDKETIFIPKGSAEVEVAPVSLQDPIRWIEYLSNFFFQAVGIPQIVLGGSQEFTEATAKIAYLAFEETVSDSQKDIEDQLWSQLALRIKLEFPASLENELLSDEKKDRGQNLVANQPVDTTANLGGAP